jgi:hypothetical protein
LPNEPVDLMFYDPDAFHYPDKYGGGTILYPGRVRPELNQSNIRIILDTTLPTPPVDLH